MKFAQFIFQFGQISHKELFKTNLFFTQKKFRFFPFLCSFFSLAREKDDAVPRPFRLLREKRPGTAERDRSPYGAGMDTFESQLIPNSLGRKLMSCSQSQEVG